MSTNADTEHEAEFAVLNSEFGAQALAEAAGIARIGPSDVQRWRKRLGSPEAAAAVLRIAQGRRQAAAKFARAQEMWLHPLGAEQSTSEVVARRKAERFARVASASGIERAVDLCAGIGGDAIALAERMPVIAVDMSQANCRRLAWNAGVYNFADRLLAVRGRAETLPIPLSNRVAIHIDPDRRASKANVKEGKARQTRRLDEYAPNLAFLRELLNQAVGCAVKISPASDFEAAFADAASNSNLEIELTSFRGECKEAVVWSGIFAECRRSAVSLPSGAVWTDRDGPLNARAPVVSWKRWVYEPDPALSRAGLLDGFAQRFGLDRVAAGAPLLTSDALIARPSSWLAEYEVLDVLPADIKRMRAVVAAHPASALDIKSRGISVTPESMRLDLRFQPSPGALPLVLFLIRGDDGRSSAVLARRGARGEDGSGISDQAERS